MCCVSQEACSLQYYFLVLWRILGVLPPSRAYVEQLKGGCSDASESDVLHTLRWSSRLRVPTYVNWIKVGGPVPLPPSLLPSFHPSIHSDGYNRKRP